MGRKPFFGGQQQLVRAVSRYVQNLRRGLTRELDVARPLAFPAHIDRVQHVAVRIAKPRGPLFEFRQCVVKIASQNVPLLHRFLNHFRAPLLKALARSQRPCFGGTNQRLRYQQGNVLLEALVHGRQPDGIEQRFEPFHGFGTLHRQRIKHIMQIRMSDLLHLQ